MIAHALTSRHLFTQFNPVVWFKKILSQPINVLFLLLSQSSLLSFLSFPFISPSSVHQMSSSFPFPLPLNPPLFLLHHKPHTLFPLPLSKPSFSPSLSQSHICFSSTSPNPDREDFLWLREEQRWLREEQRWLREEQRWLGERDSLLTEIQSLKLQIQALENRISLQGGDSVPPEIKRQVGALLPVLKEKGLIVESGSSVSPMVLEDKVKEEKKEVIRVVEREEKKKKRKVLRKGSEGEEVREMQVCFQ